MWILGPKSPNEALTPLPLIPLPQYEFARGIMRHYSQIWFLVGNNLNVQSLSEIICLGSSFVYDLNTCCTSEQAVQVMPRILLNKRFYYTWDFDLTLLWANWKYIFKYFLSMNYVVNYQIFFVIILKPCQNHFYELQLDFKWVIKSKRALDFFDNIVTFTWDILILSIKIFCNSLCLISKCQISKEMLKCYLENTN